MVSFEINSLKDFGSSKVTKELYLFIPYCSC